MTVKDFVEDYIEKEGLPRLTKVKVFDKKAKVLFNGRYEAMGEDIKGLKLRHYSGWFDGAYKLHQ